MPRAGRIAPLLLVPGALLAASVACAQAHGPAATEFADGTEMDTADTRDAKLAATSALLRSLTGRFRLSSAISSDRPGMLVDCVGIGAGPGLQCMRGAGGSTPAGEEANAAMQLFGLDPLALTVSYLRVDGRGIAQHAQGKVVGETLVFPRTNCVIPEDIRSTMDVVSCEEILRIRALSSGAELQFTTETLMRRFVRPPGGSMKLVESNSSATTWMKRVPHDESHLSD